MFLRIGFNTVWSTEGYVVGTRGREDIIYRADGRTLIIGAERMAYAEPYLFAVYPDQVYIGKSREQQSLTLDRSELLQVMARVAAGLDRLGIKIRMVVNGETLQPSEYFARLQSQTLTPARATCCRGLQTMIDNLDKPGLSIRIVVVKGRRHFSLVSTEHASRQQTTPPSPLTRFEKGPAFEIGIDHCPFCGKRLAELLAE